MRKLVTVIALLFCCCTTMFAQQKVGKVEKGKFVVTYDLKTLRQQIDDHLDKQGTKASMTAFSIEKHRIDGTQTEYFILLAENADQTVKFATELILSGDEFFTKLPLILDNSATCVGCPRGCSPRRHMDDGVVEWYCSPCTVGTGCKKTEHGH